MPPSARAARLLAGEYCGGATEVPLVTIVLTPGRHQATPARNGLH